MAKHGYLGELFGLKGKTAAVIGGTGVLGGRMAEALGYAGANVAVMGRSQERGDERAQIIKDAGGEACMVKVDTTSKESLKAACNTVVEKYGQVDILINAPGVNSPTPFLEIPEEEWHKIIDANLTGMFLACQVFIGQMVEQGNGGSIINISSVSSETPLSKVCTYSISKSGCNSLTRWLAREYAPQNIRVNAVAPGFFPAEQNRKILTKDRVDSIFTHTPMARFGEPQELDGAVIWLASEKAAGFVTGELIYVDGGFRAMTI
jgi:NAD(P)-dependent dehydrogenase (short-subunit alcohol dehydrogenase family)